MGGADHEGHYEGLPAPKQKQNPIKRSRKTSVFYKSFRFKKV
jgi:hypothetical protein